MLFVSHLIRWKRTVETESVPTYDDAGLGIPHVQAKVEASGSSVDAHAGCQRLSRSRIGSDSTMSCPASPIR